MTVDWKNQLEHQFNHVKLINHHTLGAINIYEYIPDKNV